MMTRRPRLEPYSRPHTSVAAAALAAIPMLACGGAATDGAKEASKPAVVTDLMKRDLEGIPGKEAVMLTVEYGPGGTSLPHRHDASVFVYVLEGSMVMRVDGHEPVTVQAGQTFYEGPQDVHLVSANASSSRPAKFLVFMVKDKGAPVGRPVERR